MNSPSPRPLSNNPLASLLSTTFKFTDAQQYQALHELYQSQLTVVTNFKPVLGEQMDLRATDYPKQVQSKQKVLEYIAIRRHPSNSMRYESDIEIAFC